MSQSCRSEKLRNGAKRGRLGGAEFCSYLGDSSKRSNRRVMAAVMDSSYVTADTVSVFHSGAFVQPDQPATQSDNYSLGSVSRFQLMKDAFDVIFYCVFGNVEGAGDFLISVT